MTMFLRAYRSLMTEIRDINMRYSTPNIQMTPFVRFNLLFLRFYLLLLVGLLVYRFISVIKQ